MADDAKQSGQSGPHAADKGKPAVTGHDVAAATAVGSASRLGLRKRKAATAEGAAAGSPRRGSRSSERSSLVTAVVVVIACLGTLALMIWHSR